MDRFRLRRTFDFRVKKSDLYIINYCWNEAYKSINSEQRTHRRAPECADSVSIVIQSWSLTPVRVRERESQLGGTTLLTMPRRSQIVTNGRFPLSHNVPPTPFILPHFWLGRCAEAWIYMLCSHYLWSQLVKWSVNLASAPHPLQCKISRHFQCGLEKYPRLPCVFLPATLNGNQATTAGIPSIRNSQIGTPRCCGT